MFKSTEIPLIYHDDESTIEITKNYCNLKTLVCPRKAPR